MTGLANATISKVDMGRVATNDVRGSGSSEIN